MDFWKWAYDRDYATIEQLRLAVELDDLTPEEFEEITGEKYEQGDLE